jgi:hypothetical protein
MKWFAIVTFLVSYEGAPLDLYIITEPVFKDAAECRAYVLVNQTTMFEKAFKEHQYHKTPNTIYCINETALRGLMELEYKDPA